MTAHTSRPARRPAPRRLRRRVLLVVGIAVAALVSAVEGASAGPTPAAGGEFFPLTPARLVHSVSGKGWSGPLQPNATKSVTVTGVAGVPATNVLGVMLHVTTSSTRRTSSPGNVWAWAAGAARPAYAVVANAPSGSVADNTAFVRVGSGGRISFHNGTYAAPVNVTVDVEGYVSDRDVTTAGATFAPLAPGRVIDTSAGIGGRSAPLTAESPWTFRATGIGGVPTTGVAAVALNLGAKDTRTDCWVQVQPAGTQTSNASYPRVDSYAGYSAQQLAVVTPNTNGDITFTTNCSSANVFADVEGYYLTADNGASGDVYVPISRPTRVIDTAQGVGVTGKIAAGRTVTGRQAVTVAGVGGVPSTADAVALNVATSNGTARGYNTVWTDGTPQPATSTVEVNPGLAESNLAFVKVGTSGRIAVAGSSATRAETNDLTVDLAGYFYHSGATDSNFGTPQFFPSASGDTFFNTVGNSGDTLVTANDTRGVDNSCQSHGSDIAIFDVAGADPSNLSVSSVNCMTSFGTRAGDPGDPDGCSWKSGGITRIGSTIYLAVARQINRCDKDESNGLQPSFNASIMKSTDDGLTWTNPWGKTSADGAAPPYSRSLGRYRAMWPGQAFAAPFFVQYGPGNTGTADGGDKYLYAVSTDGYAYNGNYLHLARVPLDPANGNADIQNAKAWQFYHGPIGGSGTSGWTSSPVGATRVLSARHRLSQPAIQYVPAMHEYVLVTFYYGQAHSDFPALTENPYTRLEFYTSPKPWGPWTNVYDHSTQRSLWCTTTSACQLISQPGAQPLTVGTANDWLGYYDPAIVQKFAYTKAMSQQMLFVNGDWMHKYQYTGENLYALHGIPFDLSALPAP